MLTPGTPATRMGRPDVAPRVLLALAPYVALALWPWLLAGRALVLVYRAAMDRLHRLLERATRIPCALGWHYDEPRVMLTAAEANGPYVLAECARCSRPLALMGAAAEAWIAEWVHRG